MVAPALLMDALGPVTIAPPTLVERLHAIANVLVPTLIAFCAFGAGIASQHSFTLARNAAPPDIEPGAYLGGRELSDGWRRERAKRQKRIASASASQQMSLGLAWASALFGLALAFSNPWVTLSLSAAAIGMVPIVSVVAFHTCRRDYSAIDATVVFETWEWDNCARFHGSRDAEMAKAFLNEHPREGAILRTARARPYH